LIKDCMTEMVQWEKHFEINLRLESIKSVKILI
jgi:hypothetical protein